MKKIVIALALLGVLFFSGCAQNPQGGKQPIGGQRDEHGCLIGAGYSYDAQVEACTRNWELDDSQKQAAQVAVKHVGKEYGLTVIEVIVYKCPGCFDVKLQRIGGEELTVALRDMLAVN